MLNRVFLIIMLLTIFCGCSKNSKTIDNADKLISEYYKTIGGYGNLKAINTKIIDGHYIEPGYNLLIKAHMEYKRPYYRIIGDTLTDFAEGFDGEAWEYSKQKGYYRTEGEAAKATKRGAEFDLSFIDYNQKGNKLEFKGTTKLQGQDFYELIVTFPNGDAKKYYFDTYSVLPRFMTKTMPLHAIGEPIDYLVSISDYRKVGNILMPFTQVERNIHTGKMVNATIIDTIIVNNEIPLNRFSPIKR